MKTVKDLKEFMLGMTNVSSLATLQKELLEYCELNEEDSEFVEDLIEEINSNKNEIDILKSEVQRLQSELDKWPKKEDKKNDDKKPKPKPASQ